MQTLIVGAFAASVVVLTGPLALAQEPTYNHDNRPYSRLGHHHHGPPPDLRTHHNPTTHHYSRFRHHHHGPKPHLHHGTTGPT
jgi:hypothetical protein